MAQLDLRCPTCGFADKVDKVSTVVESDVSVVHGEYGTYRYPTPLTKSLARPIMPTRNKFAGNGVGIGVMFLALGSVGLLGSEGLYRGISFAFIVTGLMITFASRSIDTKDKKEYQRRLARWKKADKRWDQLYYCRRDETLFNPYDGASMKTGEMGLYLNS